MHHGLDNHTALNAHLLVPLKEQLFGCVLWRRLTLRIKGKYRPWTKDMHVCIACTFWQLQTGLRRVGVEGLDNLEGFGHKDVKEIDEILITPMKNLL